MSGWSGVFGVGVSAFGLLLFMWVLPWTMPPGPAYSVNPNSCSCTCWDRLFKGRHPSAGYKSVWFNYDRSTPLLFLWTYFYLALFQASASYLFRLYIGNRMRYLPVAAYLLSIYAHFYGAWCVWNYINDRGYEPQSFISFISFNHFVLMFCDAGTVCFARSSFSAGRS